MAGRSGPLDPLRADLKKGGKPFYLFVGEQEWILSEAVALLREGLQVDAGTGYEFRRLNFHTRWEDVEVPLRNYSFFDGPKLVHLELGPKDRLKEEIRDALNSFLEESPGPTTLCITASQVKPLIAAKNRIQKNGGLVLSFAALKGKALEDWTRSCLRSHEVDFASGVPASLLDRLHPDPGEIAAEVDKLALVAGPGGRIEVADVERLVAPQPDLNIFRITDSLMPGRERELLAALVDLLDEAGQDPASLMALLASTMIQVLKARILLDQGIRGDALVTRMGGHPFAARKAANLASRGTRRQFTAWILNLQKLDVRMRQVQPENKKVFLESYLLESLEGRILST